MADFMPRVYRENKFWKFVLSDDPSLKVFFDVLRNYGIASGLLLAGRWLHTGSPWLITAVQGVGMCFVVLNSLQLWVLLVKTFYATFGFRYEELYQHSFTGTIKTFGLLLIFFGIPVFVWIFTSAILRQAAGLK